MDSVKSHLRRLLDERLVNERLGTVKATSPEAAMRNFAPSDVYLGCRLGAS